MGCLKKLLRAVALLYLLGLAAAWLSLRLIGEGSPVTGSALFLPVYSWILPAIALGLAGLLFDGTTTLVMCTVVAGFAWVGMGLRMNKADSRRDGDLVLVSANLGMVAPAKTLQPFVKRQNPDVICVQEAYGRLAELQEAFPEYEARSVDQFPILSRFPIVSERVIEMQEANRRQPCAARYEIEYHGQRIAIFNVHLPTPRSELKEVWQNPRMLQPWWLDPEEQRLRRGIVAAWRERSDRLEQLHQILQAEKLPFIVVGDFNMPSLGAGYAKITRNLQDAFLVGGRGVGWTFPSDRLPPLQQLSPWLRIDYQFASRDWQVCESEVEAKRPAQHLGMAARYRLAK